MVEGTSVMVEARSVMVEGRTVHWIEGRSVMVESSDCFLLRFAAGRCKRVDKPLPRLSSRTLVQSSTAAGML